MSHFACGTCRQVEWRHGRPENVFGRSRHRLLDSHSEWNLIEDVFDLEGRGNLDQGKALRLEPEDSALCHVQDCLIIFARLLGAERQMLDLGDKLFTLAFEREAMNVASSPPPL